MLDEFSAKYIKCAVSTEKVQFHKAFAEKQRTIAELKNQIKNNNIKLSLEVASHEKVKTPNYKKDDIQLEEEVINIEKEVNELSREFKDYLIRKI
jgi:MarR-like DNA-binding transcriptional regulator SgrR of sgrS sRNA